MLPSKNSTSSSVAKKLVLLPVGFVGILLLLGILARLIDDHKDLEYVSTRLGIETSDWNTAGAAFENLFEEGATREQVHTILRTVDPELINGLPNRLPECNGSNCCEVIDAFLDTAEWRFSYVFCYDPDMRLRGITLAY